MRSDRIFLDTNVLLSGLVYRGNEYLILQLAIQGSIHILLSDVVLAEARRVLETKFPEHIQSIDELLAIVDYEFIPAPPPEAVSKARELVRDPTDAPVLASMLICEPDYVLTGDKDLLTEEVQVLVPTCTCSQYLRK